MVGQYPNGDFSVVQPPMFLDTLSRFVKLNIKVRKNDYVIRMKYGREKYKYVVTDLEQPIETHVGTLSFNILRPDKIKADNRYEIVIYPLPSAVDFYKGCIQVTSAKKDSKVILISSTTDIPLRSKDFIQRLIEAYNLDAIADKNVMAENTASFIEERLRVIEHELMQAEENTVQYQEKYGILDPEIEAELFLSENVEYRKRMIDIETQLSLINYLCEFLEKETNSEYLLPATFNTTMPQQQADQMMPSNVGIADAALIAAIEEYNTLMLKRMRIERTAKNENPMKGQLDEQLLILRANIVMTMKNMRETLLLSKKDLDNRFAMADELRSKMPEQVKDYEKMVREKKFRQELYLYLCQKQEENAMLKAATVMPAKIITKPQVNPNSVSPKLNVILVLFLIIGLAFPIGVIFLYDLINEHIPHEAKELEKILKVPFAGVLVKNHHGEHIAVREGENSVSAELFRTLRTNIRFMQPASVQCPVILVTSSINGEGKSYVATNLAISMALLGKKVALLGLDIRKPMLADYLNLPTQGCLTSYLSDESYTLEDAVVASSVKNLDILPAGIIPPNPSELLQGDRLDVLFTELRKRYDCVVVDSAPVALVSDTFLLNRVADMTVYVTRANYTTFDLVDFLNQTNEQQRLPKIVAVLNGVDAKKIGYGYGYGYGQPTQPKKWWQFKGA
jgi:capsular exopolysaccharide synthesis family protein